MKEVKATDWFQALSGVIQAVAAIVGIYFIVQTFNELKNDNLEMKSQFEEMRRQSGYLSNSIQCQIEHNGILKRGYDIEYSKWKIEREERMKNAEPELTMSFNFSTRSSKQGFIKYDFSLGNDGNTAYNLDITLNDKPVLKGATIEYGNIGPEIRLTSDEIKNSDYFICRFNDKFDYGYEQHFKFDSLNSFLKTTKLIKI